MAEAKGRRVPKPAPGRQTAFTDTEELGSVGQINIMPNASLIVCLISITVFLASCNSANQASIFRKFSVDDGASISIDAHQRAIITSKEIDENGVSRNIYCAEPSPDAFSSITSSLGLKVGKLHLSDKDSATLTKTLASTASAALSTRTATIQLLRDGLYRACEAHAAGAFSKHEYKGVLRRYQNMILALLSIEFLTGINQSNNQPIQKSEEGTDTKYIAKSGNMKIGLMPDSIAVITMAAERMVEKVLERGHEDMVQQRIDDCLVHLLQTDANRFESSMMRAQLCSRLLAKELRISEPEETRLRERLLSRREETRLRERLLSRREEDENSIESRILRYADFSINRQKEVPAQTDTLQIGQSRVVQFQRNSEPQWFSFQVSNEGNFKIRATVESKDLIDPAIKLYKKTNTENKLEELARSDDSDDTLNAKIELKLNTAKYFLNLYDLLGRGGKCSIEVSKLD